MNITLIGMPGAGKSTLGVLLAKALGMNFIDTDIAIQQHEGMLLQRIIDKSGIERFLELEETVITKLDADNCVIATGGSAIYSEKAIDALKHSGKVIYIHVDFKEISSRLKNISTRGIVLKPGQSLKDIYEERLLLYNKYSDITVVCTGKSIEQCVSELVECLK